MELTAVSSHQTIAVHNVRRPTTWQDAGRHALPPGRPIVHIQWVLRRGGQFQWPGAVTCFATHNGIPAVQPVPRPWGWLR
jgi:hypothetical protein